MPILRPVRRGQLISPFGIGAMVDFPKDESLMPAGLDVWPCAKQECPSGSGWLVREERLEARLGVTHFRMPPDHRDSDGGNHFANQKVPCAFPPVALLPSLRWDGKAVTIFSNNGTV